MKRVIVADAGPLIALSRIGRLALLRSIFRQVVLPAVVVEELRLEEDRLGVEDLQRALTRDGWLKSMAPQEAVSIAGLDAGEAHAIHLAEQLKGVLLMDERRGRNVAVRRGLPVVGTGRILLEAHQRGLIPSVSVELTALRKAGYRLSDALCRQLLLLADEIAP